MDRTFIFQSVFCLHCVYHLNLFRFFKKRNSFHKEDVLANSVKFSRKPYTSGNMHVVFTTKNRLDGREIQWLRRPRKLKQTTT